jgi:alkanesulfonate monooxygenase SsuD/methylene tetrahydromethanopterin reductase-like flavin-dependent oxidoreductase (luciferase family)
MAARLQVGIQLPATDGFGAGFDSFVPVARAAEERGFDGVWVGDHLSYNAPVLESFVALSAAAAVTDRVVLGLGVLVAALRQPAWTAKQISSLQALSGSRMALGVGVGGEFPGEWVAAGVPRAERGERTDSFLAALPGLLSGRPATLGRPWNADVPPLTPYGAIPPMWVGGRKDAALRRVIRHRTGWLGVWQDATTLAERSATLANLAEEHGIARPPIALQVLVHPTRAADRGRSAMKTYMEKLYGIPYERVERYCVGGDEHELIDRLGPLVEVGLHTLVLIPAVRKPLQDLPTLARVAEALRARSLRSI